MRAGKTSHKYEEEDVSKKHFPASETQEENETKEETEDPVREKNLSDKGIVDADVISTGEMKMAATKKMAPISPSSSSTPTSMRTSMRTSSSSCQVRRSMT